MSEFQTIVRIKTDQALARMRKWDKEQAAKEVMRDYLSEEGLITKSGSKLEELLEQRHRIAISAVDPEVRLKAINSSLEMASGNDKVNNQTNIQFNLGDFVNGLKE